MESTHERTQREQLGQIFPERRSFFNEKLCFLGKYDFTPPPPVKINFDFCPLQNHFQKVYALEPKYNVGEAYFHASLSFESHTDKPIWQYLSPNLNSNVNSWHILQQVFCYSYQATHIFHILCCFYFFVHISYQCP